MLKEYTENLFSYKNFGEYIEITGSNEKAAEVEIPAEIENLPVTVIGEGAFNARPDITSIKLPDSIKVISSYAFYGCSGISSIIIPNGVVRIGNYAFNGCTNLTEISIPESVTDIYSGAFNYCSNLKKITIFNPKCKIYDSPQTISNTKNDEFHFYDENEHFIYIPVYQYSGIICGHHHSTAQNYAKRYDRKFILL